MPGSLRGAWRIGLSCLLVTGCVDLATEVGLDAIEVRVTVTPDHYSRSQGPVWLRYRITARNTTGDYVSVQVGGPPYHIAPDPTPGAGVGFSLRVDDATGRHVGPAVDTWGQPTFVFGGGQTQSFEDSTLVNNANWPLEPGTYRVVGYFGGRAGPPATLVVTP